MSSNENQSIGSKSENKISTLKNFNLKKIVTNENELSEHENMLSDMYERTSVEPIWRKN